MFQPAHPVPSQHQEQTVKGCKLDLACFPLPAMLVDAQNDVLLMNELCRTYLSFDNTLPKVSTMAEMEDLTSLPLRASMRKAMETGASTCLESSEFVDKAGNRKRASVTFVPLIPDDSSTRENCLCAWLDSTEEWHLEQRLNIVQSELSIVSQVSAQLGGTLKTGEIFKIVLIAVTAREGLGFNRAFLFMTDESTGELTGHHAIGPRNAEEAGRIWGAIPNDGMDLRGIIGSYRNNIRLDDLDIDQAVRQVRLRQVDPSDLIFGVLHERRSEVISDAVYLSSLLARTGWLFGATDLAVAPLYSKGGTLGIIAADNMITGRPISESDLEQLQMFANQTAMAIERARLYENLQSHVMELEKTNRQLEKSQQEIIKIEKLSLMGEMTYRIAHELRNPLTIIGGFANLLTRTENLPATAVERSQIIQKECRRIENQLAALLDFSKSYSQEKTEIDLNALAADVADIVQPRLARLGVDFRLLPSERVRTVYAHKDQVLHGLYTVVELLGELSPAGTCWGLLVRSEQGRPKIEVIPMENKIPRGEVVGLMQRFVHGRTGTSDLRLSLANEAIGFNGGELGFEMQHDQPRIYVAFEK